MKLKYIIQTAAIIASFSLTSCSEKKEETSPTKTPENTSSLELEKIILKKAPANAVGIADVRKNASAGDEVVFNGKVMGANIVFIKGRAMMILGDPDKLTSCDLKPGDNCERPWDVCCDAPKDIKENILTVQVLDTEGEIIKQGLKGLAGIKELSNVIITGVVDKTSNKDTMMVNVTGIFVND